MPRRLRSQNSGVLLVCARTVLLILLLLAGSLSPPRLFSQDPGAVQSDERTRGFSWEQNSPSPVDPDTWIPFTLDDRLFEDHDSVVVTFRIVNVLNSVVAFPEVRDAGTARRIRLLNAVFRTPGRRLAYWDGKDSAGRRVPSGIYYCKFEIAGEEPLIRKILVHNGRRRNFIPLLGND